MNEQKSMNNKLIFAVDVILTTAVFVLSYFIRKAIPGQVALYPMAEYFWILFVILPTLYLAMNYYGFYSAKKSLDIFSIVYKLLICFMICGIVSSAAVFITKNALFSRLYFGIFLVLDYIVLLTEKLILRRMIIDNSQKNETGKRIVIVGLMEKARKLVKDLKEQEDFPPNIVGYVSLDQNYVGEILGTVDQLPDILIQNAVDEVIFALPKDYVGQVEEHIRICEELGVTARMILDFYDLKISKTLLSYIGNLPVLTFHTVSLNEEQLFAKRVVDIIGSLIGLLFTALAFIIFAPVIKLTSKGPVFFVQKRVGQNGRVFNCYKFRTMVADAEDQLSTLKEENEMHGNMFKMKDDPRVTKIGRFLRAYSIDELPQFYNVLRGDMSLVGTRPPTVSEVSEYELKHRRRLSIKPGLTGMWQVSGRNEISDFEQVYALDINYIDNWTLLLDFKIMLKTIGVVITKKGAS